MTSKTDYQLRNSSNAKSVYDPEQTNSLDEYSSVLRILPNRDEPPSSILLEKWNAILSGGEECNLRVSSPRKLALRDLTDHSVCASIWRPPLWVLLSAVPVFWLWLTELDHVLNQSHKRSDGDRIEWKEKIENVLVL